MNNAEYPPREDNQKKHEEESSGALRKLKTGFIATVATLATLGGKAESKAVDMERADELAKEIKASMGAKEDDGKTASIYTGMENEDSASAAKHLEREVGKEVAGLKFEGMVPVVTSDTTKEVFFVFFSDSTGASKDHKIGSVLESIKELGLKPSTIPLSEILQKNPNIVKKIGGYGMAIDTTHLDGDQGRVMGNEANIVYETVNPTERVNRFEQDVINTIDVSDYGYLAEKQKPKPKDGGSQDQASLNK